jgi:hypothetical protein
MLAEPVCVECLSLVGAGPLQPPHADIRVAKDGVGGYFLHCLNCRVGWTRQASGWSRLLD